MGAMISEVGAILTEADFKTLYATATNPNVLLLQNWYTAGTQSNKIFANKLIVASLTAAKTSTAPSTATTSATCPVTTYAAFGSLYSKETAGKTWPQITKIDSWVRLSTTAVGAPLSVRQLRDCYKNTLSTAEQKHFTDNAVAHMKAGAAR